MKLSGKSFHMNRPPRQPQQQPPPPPPDAGADVVGGADGAADAGCGDGADALSSSLGWRPDRARRRLLPLLPLPPPLPSPSPAMHYRPADRRTGGFSSQRCCPYRSGRPG
uniref:Uncharacterized protein n=1 Tax=Anopheles coluzzii TaxID=1518534 RepID=A0A8W7PH52_ANOCL